MLQICHILTILPMMPLLSSSFQVVTYQCFVTHRLRLNQTGRVPLGFTCRHAVAFLLASWHEGLHTGCLILTHTIFYLSLGIRSCMKVQREALLRHLWSQQGYLKLMRTAFCCRYIVHLAWCQRVHLVRLGETWRAAAKRERLLFGCFKGQCSYCVTPLYLKRISFHIIKPWHDTSCNQHFFNSRKNRHP